MNTENINFKQLQELPYVSDMLFALEKGLRKYDINFYLLGAIEYKSQAAINNNNNNNNPKTYFSFFINERNIYYKIREYLINKEGFTGDERFFFTLKWQNNIIIDLLPFSEYQTKPSTVTIALTSMDVIVFNIPYCAPQNLTTNSSKNKHFNFCSLPGIVLLKLISFEQYPDKKLDIIRDITKIIKHFFDLYTCEIYKKHNDLFSSNDINLQYIAGRIIGRDMRTKTNEDVFFKIKKILEKNAIDIRSSEIAKIMTDVSENTVQENLKILKEIKIGYLEN